MSKTVLITGTSNGFGKDIALTLVAAGHRFGASRSKLSQVSWKIFFLLHVI